MMQSAVAMLVSLLMSSLLLACEQPQLRLTIKSPDGFTDLDLSVDYRLPDRVVSLPFNDVVGYVEIVPDTQFTIDAVGCLQARTPPVDVGEGEGEGEGEAVAEPGQSQEPANCRFLPNQAVQRGCAGPLSLQRGEELDLTIQLFSVSATEPPVQVCPIPL